MDLKEFLSSIDQDAVVAAIGRAEKACSGEIRVHIEPRTRGGDLRHVAEKTFERLGMTRTAARNGVLLFIASEEQSFVILGDRGIDEKTGPGFWNELVVSLSAHFAAGRFTEGIVEVIERAGEKLAAFFPRDEDDINELPDGISIGNPGESDV